MNRSAFSIRMEGGLERLPELGERYERTARSLRAVTPDTFAIVCSRVEGLLAEDAIFLRLLETAERLSEHGTAHDRRVLAQARSQRDALVAELRETGAFSLVERWSLAKQRLRLRFRLQAARARFAQLQFGFPTLRHLAVASLPTVGGAVLMVATGSLQTWAILVVAGTSVAAWTISKVDAVTHCPYCPGSSDDVDWFDDAPAIRSELLKHYRNPWQLRCLGCGMTLTNLDRAIAALERTALSVASPDAPLRRLKLRKAVTFAPSDSVQSIARRAQVRA